MNKVGMPDIAVFLFFLAFSALSYSIYSKNGTGSWISCVLIIVSLIFMNLDRIESFKASAEGVEANIRELKEATQEAKATVKELQGLASNVVSVSFDSIQRHGRIGPYDEQTKEALKSKLLKSLEDIGISKGEQKKILDEHWHRYIMFDFAHALLGGNWTNNALKLTPQAADMRDLYAPNLYEGKLPTPEQIENFYNTAGVMTDQKRELIEDYRYYLEHNEFRHPESWSDRQSWITPDTMKAK
jgi:hypothetical protein